MLAVMASSRHSGAVSAATGVTAEASAAGLTSGPRCARLACVRAKERGKGDLVPVSELREALAPGAGGQHNSRPAPNRRECAHRSPQRSAHPRRPRHPDGRSAAPLLASDRRRQRARQEPGQADPADGREPRPLQGSPRHVRPGRPALPAPPRRHVLRLGRGERHPLQLSRLALRRERRLHRSAVRGHHQPEAVEGRLRDQGLSGARDGGAAVGLHGPEARARAAGVGAVRLAERFSRNRAGRRAVQLVSGPGELHRSRALRMDARQLVATG